MSTTIVGKTLRTVGKVSATVVGNLMVDSNILSDFVKKTRADKRLSTPEIERKSGGDIKDATVTKIENGNVEIRKIQIGTLEALARGMEVPPLLLCELAIGKDNPISELEKMISIYARDLPEHRKKDLLEIAKLFFVSESQESTNHEPVKLENATERMIRNAGKAKPIDEINKEFKD